MNKENSATLWKLIQEAGDYLKGKLPEHSNHLKNSYAHVAICIRSKFKSYKDVEDEKFQEVIEYIEYLK